MQRQVELIGAAWGLGGADPGCAEAPAALAPLLAARLEQCGAPSAARTDAASGAERAAQAVRGQQALRACSPRRSPTRAGAAACRASSAATTAAPAAPGPAWRARCRGDLGLLWIDAHMDSHTPGTSHTGRLHGMPLAWLLGEDDDPLYGLASGVLRPEHVCIVGVRSFEREEAARLERLGVRVFHFEEVVRRGLEAVLDEALGIVTAGTERFGVSIDLDVITPEEVPHVGTPVAGGLASGALARELAAHRRASGARRGRAGGVFAEARPGRPQRPRRRSSFWPPRYAGRARMRRSSPTRSVDSSLSFSLFSSDSNPGRSSMPCAASPRKLGLR